MQADQLKQMATQHVREAEQNHQRVQKRISQLHVDLKHQRTRMDTALRSFARTQLTENLSRYHQEIQSRQKASQLALERFLAESKELPAQIQRLNEQIGTCEQHIAEQRDVITVALKNDGHWQALAAEAEYAQQRLENEQVLHQSLMAEYQDKIPGYINDPAFSYLLSRQFDTLNYRGWGLAASLDRRLARKTGFIEQKRNYVLLEQLREIAEKPSDTLVSDAQRKQDRLAHYENAAYDTEELTSLYEQLGVLSNLRQQAEKALQRAMDAIKQHQRGEDHNHVSAQQALIDQIAELSLSELQQLARETHCDKDDNAVSTLFDARLNTDRLSLALSEAQTQLEQTSEVLNRAKLLLKTVGSTTYSSSRYHYRDGRRLADTLSGYMLGRINLNALENQVREQRYTPPPPPPVQTPYSSSGGFGTSGGFGSSGGFKTTGGIGGGGFKTTGGF